MVKSNSLHKKHGEIREFSQEKKDTLCRITAMIEIHVLFRKFIM